MYTHLMPIVPDLRSLATAADAVDRTAATVDADVAAVDRLVGELPWRGPRREMVVASATTAVGVARGQVAAERALARALRQLALDVEHELRVLADMAARARRHLEELLQRAQALVAATADAVASAVTHGLTRVVAAIVTADPAAALREARHIADQAARSMQAIVVRLGTLPEPHDPAWRQLGPIILGWRPL